MTANQFYEQYLKDIAVTTIQIDAARSKRDELAGHALAVLRAYGTLGTTAWYPTGAMAMGTQIAPLNDVDLVAASALALQRWVDDPQAALDDLADGINARMTGITVTTSAHAVKVTFDDEDFTADVVYGNTRPGGSLLIPHCPLDAPGERTWIATHPARHAQMVRDRNKTIGYEFARIVRILKSLNRKWGLESDDGKKPLSSWHMTALALTLIMTPGSYAERIPAFLAAASTAVLSPLPDPTGVGADLEARDPAAASVLLRDAAARTAHANTLRDPGPVLRDVFGDPASMLAAVSGKPVSFGAGGVMIAGTTARTSPNVQSYGDAA